MSSSTRRLLKETTDLQKNPSPHFTAAPISDTSLHDWHFTLTGPPPPSPFSTGIYHGRITFPPTYPLRPPSFRFLTPTGRFEVNREICLSISGHHEESWQPAWGVRTALLAIRSYMDVDAKGQVGGLEMGDAGRRELAGESRGWRCGIEGCNGGKSNEEVLREWREGVCRERGVVDEENDQGDCGDASGDGENEEQKQQKKQQEAREAREDDAAQLNSTPVAEPAPVPVPEEPRESSGESQHQPQPQPQHQQPIPSSAPQYQHQSQPQPQTQIQFQPQPVPTPTTTTTATAAQDSPWLDRAIIGVLIALVVTIMRRIFREESEDL
ncbi:ubiquitin-conjugating enzyme E2 [Aspergillus ruber CBS 135680]|uniref:UBC-like protein n=1 Tax=Aspergillus ruber (strain CBS 135680) TaxID=1388766 RepID=A0A017SI07_ASPRC|nr:UBC-like protein [Aspergillus ruber CBS 135680]EYE96548.1 UBC-like protein [Aspergillus ruber CBS 135680]